MELSEITCRQAKERKTKKKKYGSITEREKHSISRNYKDRISHSNCKSIYWILGYVFLHGYKFKDLARPCLASGRRVVL